MSAAWHACGLAIHVLLLLEHASALVLRGLAPVNCWLDVWCLHAIGFLEDNLGRLAYTGLQLTMSLSIAHFHSKCRLRHTR